MLRMFNPSLRNVSSLCKNGLTADRSMPNRGFSLEAL
jgi:hypothetical protein